MSETDAHDSDAAFNAGSWFVLSVAAVVVGLSLVQTLYRLTLPSPEWSFARDATGTGQPLVLDRHLADGDTALRHGDVLVAVAGQSATEMLARALTLEPQPPASWQIGQRVAFTVERDGRRLLLDVPLGRPSLSGSLGAIGRSYLLNPSVPLTLLLSLFVFLRRNRSTAARWLVLLGACAFAADGLSQAVSGSNVVGPPELFDRLAFWPAQLFGNLIWPFAVAPIYIALFLVFPVTRWPARTYPRLTPVVLFAWMPALALLAAGLSRNQPLVFWNLLSLFSAIDFVLTVLMLMLVMFTNLSAAREAQRRAQTRWVAWGALLTSLGALVGLCLGIAGQLGEHPLLDLVVYRLPMLALPVALAIAILRFRLFDIDILIRRTLVYSVLSVLLALVYLAGVLLLEQAFRILTGQGQPEFGTVLVTLSVAALFVPLRLRVQASIDRRFYRPQYDAAQILAASGDSVRDETDLSQLKEQLLEAVTDTLQPTHASLWLRSEQRHEPAIRRHPRID